MLFRPAFAVMACALLTAPAVAQCPGASVAPLAAPHLARAIALHRPAEIVAFGSSSTQGFQASDPAHAYPAQLQRDLAAALPTASVAVLNRGIGGQDAGEEVRRIASDVIALHPDLAIWQLGANAVMERMDPARFEELVEDGVRTIRAAGIDVVLMDNQRAPFILAQPGHQAIEDLLARVATEEHVPLFPRGHLMDLWQAAGFPYADFLAGDGVHHNDLGYACIAGALSQSLIAGLRMDVADR